MNVCREPGVLVIAAKVEGSEPPPPMERMVLTLGFSYRTDSVK